MTTRALWAAARQFAAVLVDATVTGRSWRRPATQHPEWCAEHRCTATRLPAGEHRSEPSVWRTPYGTLIVTRTLTNAGRSGVEVRADVRLAADEDRGRLQARLLVVGVDLTVRAVLAETAATLPGLPVSPARPAVRHHAPLSARPEVCS